MFPQASRYPTFKTVTNPYDCTLGDVRFVTKTFVVMIVWSFKMKFEYNPEKNSIKANLLLSKEAQCWVKQHIQNPQKFFGEKKNKCLKI